MTTIERAIKQAKEFLLKNRQDNGAWKDFKTNTHGESIDWITSYVGLSMIESGVEKAHLEKTAKFIFDRQNSQYKGWGYNKKIGPDADSTAFAILFLSYFNFDLQNAKDFLLQHQNRDGSFSTYLSELAHTHRRIPPEMSVKGWCSGNVDVTTSAMRALNNNRDSISYLLNQQTHEGNLISYWYNDDIHSTTFFIQSVPQNKTQQIEKAREWLASQETHIPFYKALKIQGLIPESSYKKEIERETKNLITTQQLDGSWTSHPILRFPMPWDTKPWKTTQRWREDGKDQNRLFTTATCLKALSTYTNSF